MKSHGLQKFLVLIWALLSALFIALLFLAFYYKKYLFDPWKVHFAGTDHTDS